jgi:hypothetical protein
VLGVGQVGEACRESEVILLKKQANIFNKINANLSEKQWLSRTDTRLAEPCLATKT